MRAFAIIGIWAVAFAGISCNNSPDEEPLPTEKSISSVPSVTTVTCDQSILEDQEKISRTRELASGASAKPTTLTPPATGTMTPVTGPTPPEASTTPETSPTPSTTSTPPETAPETSPEKTPETAPAATGDPVTDVKKIMETMIVAAKGYDTAKLMEYLIDDQAEQFNQLIEAGKTLKQTLEETKKLLSDKLGEDLPPDIAAGAQDAAKTEKNSFIETLKAMKVEELTITESNGKVTVEVGLKTKQLFLTFSKIDTVWKAEMEAAWAGSLKSGKDRIEKYTNLLNDVQMAIEDGSLTKETRIKVYDELKKKYNITMTLIAPD